MAEDKPFHVLVIGGGITGLLVAQGLKKNGISCTVYESEPSAEHYRPREWGLSIQWGLPLLEDILPEELWDRFYTVANDPYFPPPDPGVMPTWNGATGELIKNIPLLKMRRVSRRKFRALAAEGIQVEYGKILREVNYSDDGKYITATFEDNSKATGSLLVGADGAQSVVRTSLFGPEKAKALSVPYSAVNLHVKYGDAEKALFVRQKHPIMTHAIHPDLDFKIVVQDVPDPNDPATWTFQLQTTWKKKEGEDPASLALLKQKAQTFAEPFKSANLWVPENTTLSSNNLSYWKPISWDNKNGRVTIVGDAAHPMTFQRGQGMNHGIADAQILVKEITKVKTGDQTIQQAVDAYEKEMIPRAGDEVALSLVNTEMLHDWEKFQDSPLLKVGGNALPVKT